MWETFFKEALRMGNTWLSLPVACAAINLLMKGKSGRDPIYELSRAYFEAEDEDDEPHFQLGMTVKMRGFYIDSGHFDPRWVYNNYPYFKKQGKIIGTDDWEKTSVYKAKDLNWELIDAALPHTKGMLIPETSDTIRAQYGFWRGEYEREKMDIQRRAHN